MNYYEIPLPSFSLLSPLFASKPDSELVLDFFIKKTKQVEYSDALSHGSAMHDLTLESKETKRHFISTFDNFRTKAAQKEVSEWLLAQASIYSPEVDTTLSDNELKKILLDNGIVSIIDNCKEPYKNWNDIMGLTDSALANERFSKMINSTKKIVEKPFFGTLFGLEMKCKPDLISTKYMELVDLKTVKGGVIQSDKELIKHAESYNLPCQLIIYQMLLAQNGYKNYNFSNFFVCKSTHYTRWLMYNRSVIDRLERKIHHGIELYKKIQSGEVQPPKHLESLVYNVTNYYC